MKTWLITGCSSGIGRSLAKIILEKGMNAVVTARDVTKVEDLAKEYPDTALSLSLDVTKNDQIVNVIKQAEEKFGMVDVLINNAGYGYRAAVEEGNVDEVNVLFNTNLFGPIELIKAVLPKMREAKSGAIINISSIAAQTTAAGSGYYSASKAALESISYGLYKEVSPLGIKVMIVEPGAFRTDFAGRSLTQSKNAISDYANTAGLRRIENDKTHGTQPGDPDQGARLIVEAITQKENPLRLLLGSDAVKVITEELKKRLEGVKEYSEFSKQSDYSTNN